MRFVVYCTLLLLLFILPVCAFASPIIANKMYQGGSEVSSTSAGISFVIPTGLTGQYDAETKGFLMRSSSKTEGGQLFGVFAYSKIKLKAVTEYVFQSIEDQGYNLVKQAYEKLPSEMIKVEFLAYDERGINFTLIGYSKKGDYGNGVVVIGMGNSDNSASTDYTIKELLNSMKWMRPNVKNIETKLAGKCFKYTGNSYENDNQVTYASSIHTRLDICSNGSYSFEYKATSYEGGRESKVDDGHQGHWSVIADLGNTYYLELSTAQKRYFLWPVLERGDKISISGNSFTHVGTPECR